MHRFMQGSELVEKLSKKYSSPFNMLHIPTFQKNIKNYQKVFEKLGIDGQIYFARKANKSLVLVKTALDAGIGVDTASYKELKQAIDFSGTHKSIVLTAAIKNENLLQLAIENQIPIIIDNLDELQLANKIATDLKKIAVVGLRLSGFRVGGEKLYSRFGFDIERDVFHLAEWFMDTTVFPSLKLTGFHFHLNGYSIEERGEAALQTIEVIQRFRVNGHNIDFLDIGGGILMNYLESKKEWKDFKYRLKQAVLGKEEPITFNNNGLGYGVSDNNQVIGNLNTYPYYNEVNGAEFLEQVLAYENTKGESVAQLVKKLNIQLRIEPGRSLLNQVGLTVAGVVHRKRDAMGNWLVGLEMNMSQLKSSSADFLLDPYIIYRNDKEDNTEQVKLYFTGGYCLEQDVLLKRQLTFPKLPTGGDNVIFINTAGYLMHFYETESHLFELSEDLYLENDNEVFDIDDVQKDTDLNEQISSRQSAEMNL
ncbi:MAG: Y4yA family PLP-dependent enzyme [Pricia sp.]|nr:Y4yA family PLP-dependent enzyme [Pricia sp.]